MGAVCLHALSNRDMEPYMANSKKYLNHLLQRTEITPACSEEERTAADVIARIFTDHGFNPEI